MGRNPQFWVCVLFRFFDDKFGFWVLLKIGFVFISLNVEFGFLYISYFQVRFGSWQNLGSDSVCCCIGFFRISYEADGTVILFSVTVSRGIDSRGGRSPQYGVEGHTNIDVPPKFLLVLLYKLHWTTPEVGRLWLMGHMQPASSICAAHRQSDRAKG